MREHFLSGYQFAADFEKAIHESLVNGTNLLSPLLAGFDDRHGDAPPEALARVGTREISSRSR